MNPLTTLIVEDDKMTRKIIEKFVEQTDFLELVAVLEDGIAGANFLMENHVDLLLLDVEMPGMNGVELLKSLAEPPQVVMITSKEKYAVEAFELNVADYIVKPLEYPRFLKAVKRAQSQIPDEKSGVEGNSLFVKVDGQHINIPFSQIHLIESRSDYITIHTPEKRYTVYATMKGVLQKLPESKFIRVHRSYIIPLDHIKTFEDNTLAVGEKLIPVGITYRDKLLSRLNIL